MKYSKNTIIEEIKKKSSNTPEITYKEIDIKGVSCYIVYTDSTASQTDISDFLIKGIANIANDWNIEEKIDELNKSKVKVTAYGNKKEETSIKASIEKCIYACSVKKIDFQKDDIFYYIYSGFVIVITDEELLAVELKQNLSRSISEPLTEGTVKGPKDAFVENYKTNLGLVRRRIKTEKLIIHEQKLGTRTKTQVGILYISDIAKVSHVEKIKKKLNEIQIDGILDSNQIREILISGGTSTDFPTILSTERPDLASKYLLDGRIVIIVDGTPFALVLPSFLEDHMKNIEDYYQKSSSIFFTRIIRMLAFIVTLVTPAMYIALTTFNHEALPLKFLISFAIQRSDVPFPAFLEAIIMIIAFEFLKEGDNRVSGTMGGTLSIVGAIVIGDAAVSAGIVSPIMIIVIAMAKISGLLFQDINFANAIRNWRLIFLLFASIAGLYGFMIALIIFIYKLSSINFLGAPYLYPFAPINKSELITDTIARENITKLDKREDVLTNNITRIKIKNGGE